MTGCHPKINGNKVIDFMRKTKITLFVLRSFVYSVMSKSELHFRNIHDRLHYRQGLLGGLDIMYPQ
jgi:hypothetical protein